MTPTNGGGIMVEIQQDAYADGLREGRAAGYEEGREDGYEEGYASGYEDGGVGVIFSDDNLRRVGIDIREDFVTRWDAATSEWTLTQAGREARIGGVR